MKIREFSIRPSAIKSDNVVAEVDITSQEGGNTTPFGNTITHPLKVESALSIRPSRAIVNTKDKQHMSVKNNEDTQDPTRDNGNAKTCNAAICITSADTNSNATTISVFSITEKANMRV